MFLDVRDPIEISFVGHAQGMDANVPIATGLRDLGDGLVVKTASGNGEIGERPERP